MTPADLSALIEEAEKMEEKLRARAAIRLKATCRGADDRLANDLNHTSDLLSRFRDALRGGVMVPRTTLEAAASKLRQMGREFSRTNFTDRYGDGPIMLNIAKHLDAALAAAPQAGAKEGKP